jgi:outer membrane protein assembly factor BamB
MRIIPLIAMMCLCAGADWPQWRGPSGQGHTAEKALVTEWDGKSGKNVLWKTPLPKGDTPYSSPIVKSGKVFITLAMNKTRAHHVLCFDAKTGQQLWDTPVEPGPWTLTDVRGGYAAPTPAADDKQVYVLFGSAVIAALDHSGKIVWRKPLEKYAFDVAIGCSPILYKDTLILQADMLKKQSSLIAFDCATGDIKWEAPRPDVGFAHSTPTLVEVNGKPQLLIAASDALQGADPDTGKLLWWAKAKGDTVSPVMGGNIVYIDSGRGGAGFAVDPTGAGDVGKTHVKWSIKQVPEAFGSPIIVGPNVYRLHSPGVLKCWRLSDGTELYSQRLEGASAAVSPVATADGLIYFASPGRTHVIRAADTFEPVAASDLGDPNYASPAVADGRIYLKGVKFLYCVGSK